MDFFAIICKNGIKKIIKKFYFINKQNILIHKKFYNYYKAKKWLNKINILNSFSIIKSIKEKTIFCDSGTSFFFKTTEIKIIFNKINIIKHLFPLYLNNRNNFFLQQQESNNFGELIAIFLSLQYALKYNIKYICTDSAIVSIYWLNNFFSQNLDIKTKILIKKSAILYKIFLKNKQNKIFLIPSKYNPADLKKNNNIINFFT